MGFVCNPFPRTVAAGTGCGGGALGSAGFETSLFSFAVRLELTSVLSSRPIVLAGKAADAVVEVVVELLGTGISGSWFR